MAKVAIVLGRDLTEPELRAINHHRELEFNSRNPISPAVDNDDWQMPYFLVRHEGELVAFGRLHEIRVEFMGESYDILGIATVIAIVKARGYGLELMAAIRRYIDQNKKTAIGFCHDRVSGFYEKCGYSILRGGKSRFVFIEDGNKLPRTDPEDDVLYFGGQDKLMEKVEANPLEQITAFKHAW